jgi:hypothetical protein
MIVQNCLITLSHSAGAEVRQFKCTMRLGKQIVGEINKELGYGQVEQIDAHRLTFKLGNFFLPQTDAEWLADYVYDTDKTIGYDDMTFSVVNGPNNLDLEFEPIGGLNARATCDLEFVEAEIRGRVRETVDEETRETVPGETRETT